MCSIFAPGKQTTMSSSLFSVESVFLTMESPTYIVEFLLIPSITATEYDFLLTPPCPFSLPIFIPSVLFSCPSFLVVSLSSSCSVSSMMIMRCATGTYPSCLFPSSTNHQCVFSSCSIKKTRVSPCLKSISSPTGLSRFFLYSCVARICAPVRISFPSIFCLHLSSPSVPCSTSISKPLSLTSVYMFKAVSFSVRISPVEMSGGISPSHISFAASSSPATRSPVYPPLSSTPCPVTIISMLPNIFLRYSTSPTNLATSLRPIQVKTRALPFISVYVYILRCRTAPNSYSLCRPNAIFPYFYKLLCYVIYAFSEIWTSRLT